MKVEGRLGRQEKLSRKEKPNPEKKGGKKVGGAKNRDLCILGSSAKQEKKPEGSGRPPMSWDWHARGPGRKKDQTKVSPL